MSNLSKATLGNGLRVVLERTPHTPRTAVCVHYGVGYRSERPGREGFAHLFEHLMFRGSVSLPEGRFYEHVHPLGGQANGTTHQDYTDYHQVVPAAALERALFAEADRMRAPLFTPETLAEQLDGIATEIHEAVVTPPYGGFPWPLLPSVVFDGFANAHDGYGALERLRTATTDECADFFGAHYAPGNAVLSVVGDHDPEELLALIERHFGDIPARPFAEAPDVREPELAVDRWAECTEPRVPTAALALGYRLPAPAEDLPAHLAYAVLAEMISGHGAEGVRGASASCGVFGLLDARESDLMVVTALVPDGVSARRAARSMTDGWARLAEAPSLDRARATAVRHLVTRHWREHADPYTRARARGRLELLFGRAELLDELPGALDEIPTDAVATAAGRLSTAPKGVLVLTPGNSRTRPPTRWPTPTAPTPTAPPSTEPPLTAPRPTEPPPTDTSLATTPPNNKTPLPSQRTEGPTPEPGSVRSPRPVPPLGTATPPFHGPRVDTSLPGGTRVVAVADRRTPLVELRMRLPLGDPGWWWPDRAEALSRFLATRSGAADRADREGEAFQLTSDGQWLDITGHSRPDRVGAWLESLADLAVPVAEPAPAVPVRHRAPESVMDTALRRAWDAHGAVGAPALVPEPPGPAEFHRSVIVRGGWLVAVGDLDPEAFTSAADAALSSWRTTPHARTTGTAPRAVHPRTPGVVTLGQRGTDDDRLHLTLSAPEPYGDTGSAARYLATAVVGAHHASRLTAHGLSVPGPAWQIHAGRDVCRDVPRAYVRAVVPEREAGPAVAGIHQELAMLHLRPVTRAELAPVAAFCAAQLLGVFDSPAAKADMIRETLSAGRGPSWLEDLPALILRTSPEDVTTAATELFAPGRMTLVALGAEEPAAEAAASWHHLTPPTTA
ncbi:insulinase family protein [Streptomyces cyaneofuscatus]|uniref:M16 family metallopeptidase n=1 Tax=Streptomyces cyaneofuscatus TaxID=66883 RepID=UPI00364B7688